MKAVHIDSFRRERPPLCRIAFSPHELTNGSEVIFQVMDLTGRKVMEVNNGMMPAGKHTYNLSTSSLDAGIYFYTLRAGDFVQTKQMVVVD